MGSTPSLPQDDFKRDLELLYELGTLRHIQRAWEQFLGPGTANLAEHHFRVAWLGMLIGKRERADLGKIAKLALLHDVSEGRTGDVHYLSRLYTKRDERSAFRDAMDGTSLDQEFVELWEEYEARQTLESKCVKDADNLDVQLELRERAANGVQLEANWAQVRAGLGSTNIYTKTGRQLWQAIVGSNPHDWHNRAKNRFTAGDWKPADDNSNAGATSIKEG